MLGQNMTAANMNTEAKNTDDYGNDGEQLRKTSSQTLNSQSLTGLSNLELNKADQIWSDLLDDFEDVDFGTLENTINQDNC